MHYNFRFQKNRSIVEVRASGKATAASFAELDMDLVGHRKWIPGMNILFDFIELDLSSISAADVNENSSFVRSLSDKFGNGKIVCIMNKEIDFGIARMWEILTQDGISAEIRIFRSISEAKSWIKT